MCMYCVGPCGAQMGIDEKCADDMQPKKMATGLLMMGGAHKPETISFGVDQVVDVKSL